jgi:hypothetical protein
VDSLGLLIFAAPLDSLATSGFSGHRWILLASGFARCLSVLSAPLDSLGACGGVSGLSRCLGILSAAVDSLGLRILSASLDSLTAQPGYVRWILSFLMYPRCARNALSCLMSIRTYLIECRCRILLLCRFVYLVYNPSSVFHDVRRNVAIVDRQ